MYIYILIKNELQTQCKTRKGSTCISGYHAHLSLRASFLRSAKRGMESLNSLILSSSTWHTASTFTSLGNLRSLFRNSSMPSVSTWMFRFAHSVLDHSSRATCSNVYTCIHVASSNASSIHHSYAAHVCDFRLDWEVCKHKWCTCALGDCSTSRPWRLFAA